MAAYMAAASYQLLHATQRRSARDALLHVYGGEHMLEFELRLSVRPILTVTSSIP